MSVIKRDPCGNQIRPGDPDYAEVDMALVPKHELDELLTAFDRWGDAGGYEPTRYELLAALGRFVGACQREGRR